jgi:hypothetical protein
MFCDYLNVWQQFDPSLPDHHGGKIISIEGACGLSRAAVVDEDGSIEQQWAFSGADYELEYDVSKFSAETGSYETRLNIRMIGGRLEVRGNPSAWGRLDNLFGVGLDEGIAVYNEVLLGLGLPEFTSGEVLLIPGKNGFVKSYTGAHISRFDGTQNFAVGTGRVRDYHKWIAGQKIYRSAPGDDALERYAKWDYGTVYTSESKFYVNAKHYDKADALTERTLPEYLKKLNAAAKEGKIAYGDVRPLYMEAESYLTDLACWCAEVGISRGEWSLRNRYFAQHNGLGFWKPVESESAIWDVIGKEMDKLAKRAVVYQDDSMDSLTKSEYFALAEWKKGVDLRGEGVLTSTTFYRVRSAILKKTGHDIAARPVVNARVLEARPVYFQVRPLALRDAPIWYQRPSVPLQMAA